MVECDDYGNQTTSTTGMDSSVITRHTEAGANLAKTKGQLLDAVMCDVIWKPPFILAFIAHTCRVWLCASDPFPFGPPTNTALAVASRVLLPGAVHLYALFLVECLSIPPPPPSALVTNAAAVGCAFALHLLRVCSAVRCAAPPAVLAPLPARWCKTEAPAGRSSSTTITEGTDGRTDGPSPRHLKHALCARTQAHMHTHTIHTTFG